MSTRLIIMDKMFFRSYAVGTRLDFLIQNAYSIESINKVESIVRTFLESENVQFERFYEFDNDIGETFESQKYLFVINSWQKKGIIILDIYSTVNITRSVIYNLDEKLKKAFDSKNVFRYTEKRLIDV